jgi:DNA processing protein
MPDHIYWLALNLIPDIGPVRGRRLLSVFGTPETIFHMSSNELKKTGEISEKSVKQIVGFNQWDRVKKEIDSLIKNQIKLVTINDKEYPENLKHIPDAPLLLYMKGEIKEDDRYAVAVVGSRIPTDYGLLSAEKISSRISSYGLTVVSGMARGVDAASHRGAIRAKGRTIAVLGSGIDVPYPVENKRLMGEIEDSGAVLSEFPLGTPPNRENFPRRNRIISALSLGVVVIEATVDSGSLITVRYALEQGKEVFALPGNVTSKNSRGTNKLIKEGARLIESAEEIIDELRPQIKGILKESMLASEKMLPQMTDEEKAVFGFLDNDPKHIDTIVRNIGISSGRALSVLLNLELKGVVRQVGGKKFTIH